MRHTCGGGWERKGLPFLLGFVFLIEPVLCQVPTAYTIAVMSGPGGQLSYPRGIAVSASGTVYIADQANHLIRQVVNGTMTTVAGNGTAGYTGNGAAATNAELNYPGGVAVDSAGNLYIADTGNHAVRKVGTGGIITTIAGNNTAGYTGDGAAGTSAELNGPTGVAVDASGNVYIADTANHVIRKLSADGTITTVAGADQTLRYPEGVAIDASGNIYIADTGNALVRRLASDGTLMTVAGTGQTGFWGDGGPATSASLWYPESLAVDAAGNLFIADSFNNRVRVVAGGGRIATVAGNGAFGDTADGLLATAAELQFPSGIALDSAGRLYVVDSGNNKVKVLTPLPNSAGSAPSIGGVVSATAFGGAPSFAPGSWIEIYGSNLASGSRPWSSADFTGGYAPTSLDGTTVTIGGHPAFVAYISPDQVNVQVPPSVISGIQELTVTTAAGISAPRLVEVVDVQPGLYAPESLKVGGRQYVAAFFPDGVTQVLPANALPNVAARPARPGDTIVVYGIGFGTVSPTPYSGQPAPGSNTLDLPFQIFFGQTPAVLNYWGLAPGTLGLYQFNVVVPSVPAGDAVPFSFNLHGNIGTQLLYIAVQD